MNWRVFTILCEIKPDKLLNWMGDVRVPRMMELVRANQHPGEQKEN